MAGKYVVVTQAMEEAAWREVDWAKIDAMTDADIARQVRENPDAAPILTLAESAHGLVLYIRHRLNLTQEEFAVRYGIPLATLRDWEQGRRAPGKAVWSYLRVIGREPELVARALSNTPPRRRVVKTSQPTA